MKKYLFLPVFAVLVLTGCGNTDTTKDNPAMIVEESASAGTLDEVMPPQDSPAPNIPDSDATEKMAPIADTNASEGDLIKEIDTLIDDLDNI